MAKEIGLDWYVTEENVATVDGDRRVSVCVEIPDFGAVAEVFGPSYEAKRAIARRIAACVNACRGLTVEQIAAVRVKELIR